MNEEIEIVGISTCGTYSSWVDYTVASFYNMVDKIVVINSGYDIYNPESGAIHRLEREHSLLQKIDIHNKILEVNPTQSDIEELFSIKGKCDKGKDEYGRAGNITLATMTAHNLPNPDNKIRWILKADSDQIFYKFRRQDLENLILQYPNRSGFRFAQYADFFHDFEHIAEGLPNDFTNDGALFYQSKKNQRYGGQGSPDTHVDQQPIYTIKTAHMRRINPPDIEPYEYHFKRLWYHTFGPNQIMEHDYNRKTGMQFTNEQIIKIVHNDTLAILRTKGKLIKDLDYDERIPIKRPLVCEIGQIEYINRG